MVVVRVPQARGVCVHAARPQEGGLLMAGKSSPENHMEELREGTWAWEMGTGRRWYRSRCLKT